jgi:hypothetical protein
MPTHRATELKLPQFLRVVLIKRDLLLRETLEVRSRLTRASRWHAAATAHPRGDAIHGRGRSACGRSGFRILPFGRCLMRTVSRPRRGCDGEEGGRADGGGGTSCTSARIGHAGERRRRRGWIMRQKQPGADAVRGGVVAAFHSVPSKPCHCGVSRSMVIPPAVSSCLWFGRNLRPSAEAATAPPTGVERATSGVIRDGRGGRRRSHTTLDTTTALPIPIHG